MQMLQRVAALVPAHIDMTAHLCSLKFTSSFVNILLPGKLVVGRRFVVGCEPATH